MATSSPPARASQILADAADDVGVLAVELLVDGAVVGRDERPPYGATVTVPDDVERLTVGARAFDFAANAAASPEVEVMVARAGMTAVTGLVVGPRDEPVAAARVVVFSGAAESAGDTDRHHASAIRAAPSRCSISRSARRR